MWLCSLSSITATIIFLILHLSTLLIQNVASVAIDNDVQGEPMIECGDSSMSFTIKTKKLFAGRIFVKGKTAESSCMRADFAKQQTSTPVFDLTFGSCGMKGQRADEPRGMYYSVTLVVSFHPMFVTKVDRAYHVKCFFEESLKILTAGLDVSMINTADVTAFRPTIGTCTYTIHQGNVSQGANTVGPQISVAQVGDKIVHKWECSDSMYGIVVKSCTVTDGFGTQAEVIDHRGCPVDPILISTISYDSSLTQAFAESHVFKFADRPGVWFYCQLQMCLKMSQACEGLTPPNCGGMMPATMPGETTMPPWYSKSSPGSGSGSETTMPPWYSKSSPGSGSDTTMPPWYSRSPPSGGSETTMPPGYTRNPQGTKDSGTEPSRLPPAPPAPTPASPLPVAGTNREISLSTNLESRPSVVPSGYGPKKVLLHQRIEDDKIAMSTLPAIYEEEELIYEESESETIPSVTTESSPGDAIVVTGFRKWKRPNPTAGSLEKSITYRSHRRSTASGKKGVKRSPNSMHDTGQIEEESTTHRYQEIEKKMRRSTMHQNKKGHQQASKAKITNTNEEKETEDRFMYRDSELSNRLIIFDVDEEPPPDYLHWSRNFKTKSDHSEEDSSRENTSDKETEPKEGGSPTQSTTAVRDACVVSAQGLIMILAASGSLSALLIILLVAVCIRYRTVSTSPKMYRSTRAIRPSESEDSGISRHSNESTDRIRPRVLDRGFKKPHPSHPLEEQSSSSTISETIELPRLPCAQERRKKR